MLSPKKTKYRKQMKQVRHLRGFETRGTNLEFGEFGLRVMEAGWITNKQIEASRVAIARFIKRGGKLWLKIFPDKPLTVKPAETRMGSGKGSPEHWVAEVRAGRVLFELTGVPVDIAKDAMKKAAAKLPLKCKFVARTETLL
jgi:large subunit ribosomal protein L16